jgi:hypothetical protein
VGKTAWMVDLIVSALASSPYDLVVVLVPRWDILRELVQRLPPGLPRTILTPRPRKRCGDLDGPWVQYERQGLGSLGRAQLCGACPQRATCPWPGQYGSRLRGARLVLATQHHLTLNPAFLVHLQQQARARNVLALLDESNLLVRPVERTLRQDDLQRFLGAQEAHLIGTAPPKALESQWLELSRLVAQAPTSDLREGTWRFPWVDTEWATGVQAQGLELFGSGFRFLGYELHHFSQSDPGGRERLPNGDVRFAALPHLGSKFVVFNGSMAKELARYRIDPNHARPTLLAPFAKLQFRHPGTQWFNLNSLAGAAKFFPTNAGRVLDLIATKIARNVIAGKRTLLVSRRSSFRCAASSFASASPPWGLARSKLSRATGKSTTCRTLAWYR